MRRAWERIIRGWIRSLFIPTKVPFDFTMAWENFEQKVQQIKTRKKNEIAILLFSSEAKKSIFDIRRGISHSPKERQHLPVGNGQGAKSAQVSQVYSVLWSACLWLWWRRDCKGDWERFRWSLRPSYNLESATESASLLMLSFRHSFVVTRH